MKGTTCSVQPAKNLDVVRGFIMLEPCRKFGDKRDIWPNSFTFETENNKGADQTARMRRLVCTFVVHN